MVPSLRLIAVTCLLVPLGFIPSLAPDYGMVGLVVFCLLLLTAGADWYLSRNRLQGYRFLTPELVRMTVNRGGEISLLCGGEGRGGSVLRAALSLPAPFECEQPEFSFMAPAKGKATTLVWNSMPLRRGKFLISRLVLVGDSSWGLWELRGYRDIDLEVRVYPDLLSEQGKVSALFLQLARAGSRVRRQVGQGREFEKLRDFVPGDSLDRIHWKATAKRNKPMSKQYQVERTQEVYVLMDSSRLAGIEVDLPGRGVESVFEIYIKTALLTALVAGQQGDHFGLCTFNSIVHNFLRAKSGKNHFNACREQLFTIEPEQVSPDYRELVTFLGHKLRKRALLIILTNLDDPVLAEEFTSCVDLLNRRHLVVVMSMNPTFAKPLFSDTEVNDMDDLYRNLAGHLQDQRLQKLTRQLRKHGVHMCRPDPEKLALEVIDQYMSIKERQTL